ncbi:hypothetical protein [Burkholderia cenocepacia]|uniref:hypothetical protein n=1 Tax=Burkholderia cenocepacia TaxID=95486 RepID=UPI0013E0DD1A|nr:hypothetical protein [Burkholderia cenocepacia]MCW3587400.1 hypothetical protein [Burkholderia cenocepacia]MCW3632604.1 hypothetical protein [Burkholderia cenocepacia]MCW5181835.1 hypothetical protein [Burkholderia cenocepacia]
MKIRKSHFVCSALIIASLVGTARAQFMWPGLGNPAARAKFTCWSRDGTVHYKHKVVVNEAGQPGLIWVGMHNPGKTAAYLLDQHGQWQKYDGGLLPPAGRFDGGLPATMDVDVQLPEPGPSTNWFVGWEIYEGYGVYTKASQDKVATRRAILNEVKPSRVAEGKWSPEYDSDDRFKWALVQKDMTDNGKYVQVVTIPLIDCNATTSN